MEVNPRKTGTRLHVPMHHYYGNGGRKDAQTEAYTVDGAIGPQSRYVCVQDRRWNTTHEEQVETGNVCTYDRFQADGARTRAARVIRGLVLGVLAANGETEMG